MKSTLRLLCWVLLVLCLSMPSRAAFVLLGLSGGHARIAARAPSGTISAANAATFPSFTPGSSVSLAGVGPGLSTVTVGVQTNGLNAALHVYYSPDGIMDVQLPDALIYNVGSNSYGAISASTAAVYVVQVPPGTVYVAASSYTSGSTIVSLNSGPGTGFNPQGAAGGGGGPAANVNVTNTSLAITSADGAQTAVGTTTDTGVGDATGTAIAHLRQVAKLLGGTLTVSGSGIFTISGSVSVTGNVATTNAASSQADGHSVTLGLTTDAAVGDATGSLNAHLRQIAKTLGATVAVTQSGSWTISGTVAVTQSGTWNINNISGTVSLPTGASTSALQTTANTLLNGGLPAALGTGGGLKVDGSGTALPVSAASLPLPTGASTAAKQPALGTAGTAATDVITVQGISGMTAIKVDPSGGSVSGTVTANQGTAAASTSGWPAVGGNLAQSTATWTTATAQNTALTATVTGYASMTVVVQGGTNLTAGAITFEVSQDGSVWLPTNAFTLASTTLATTYTFVSATNAGFRVDTAGWDRFRVRLSTAITTSSGTGSTVVTEYASAQAVTRESIAMQATAANLLTSAAQNGTWTVQPGNTANTTAWKVDGSAVTQPVSGTVTANAGTGTFLGQVANEIPNGFTQEQGSSAGTAITDTTSHAMFAAISAKKHYLKFLMVTNSGATASEVQVLDGAAVIADFYVPATSGAVIPIPPGAYLVGSTNTAMNIKCVTTSTNTFWTAIAYDG